MSRAAEKGHLQVVESLLAHKAEVDSRDGVSTYNNVMYCVIIIIQSVCGIVYELRTYVTVFKKICLPHTYKYF